jgi:phage terminase large subunit-like protein
MQPDGENAGEPFRFTPEQRHFILWFYAVDSRGKWLYRTAALRRAKGWGKSPLLAALCIIEFLGPCRFWRFIDGEAVGRSIAAPWVQLAATAIHQTVNTMDSIRGMLVESPLNSDLDIGKTIIQFKDGRPGKIEPVTSNSATLEGGRPTFAVLDETHHWTESNGGHKVAEVIDRNIRKNPGGFARYVETTNAYNPGQNSTAQKTHEAVLAGAKAILYDCVEAPEVDNEWQIKDRKNESLLRHMVECAYGDSTWIDIDSILEAIYDPRTSVATAFRFYLNMIKESADTWIPKATLDALYNEGEVKPSKDKKYRRQIAVGFDGSLYHDSTAIVGCELVTGKLFLIGLWECPTDPKEAEGWSVPVFEVDARMMWASEHYEIAWGYCDESYWQNIVGKWALEIKWGKDEKDSIFAFSPQRPRQMAAAIERFETACKIRESICFDGNADLKRHILNAVRRETPYGDLIDKESKNSKKRIDAAMAAVLAYEARADAIADGRSKQKRKARMRTY